MTAALPQVVGLLGTGAVYCAALVALPWARRARIRSLPVNWSNHSEMRDFYARGPSFEMLGALRTRRRWFAARVAPIAVGSALYALVSTSIPIELGVCLLGAWWLAGPTAETLGRGNAVLTARLGLTKEIVDSALRPVYLTWSFVGTAGLLGVGCFLGGLIGTLL